MQEILLDAAVLPALSSLEDERFAVFGVPIHNVTRRRAVELIEQAIVDRRTTSIYFVNSHTLNLAAGDHAYRDVLDAGDFVFADGTGVRWAARWQGVRLRENMLGTDFTPELLEALGGRGYSYFMLGADARTIAAAADFARRAFPGCTLAGFHHGYLGADTITTAAIDQINATEPDILLVGMGNPLQEQWIHAHRARLNVPVCMGIGGLFDFWAGNVSRAPRWLRRAGHEWLWRLYQQPGLKARRYLIGNPLFLARMLRDRRR